MRIYLAGGVSGNLKPFWRLVSQKLSQGMEYREAFDESMRIFLLVQKKYAGLPSRNERHPQDSQLDIRGGV